MLALALDALFAYLLVRYVPKLMVQIVLAVVSGVVSAVLANMLMYWLLPGDQTAGEAAARMIVGAIWHPIIVILMIWFFRKTKKKNQASNHHS